jgi:hypothetical protein
MSPWTRRETSRKLFTCIALSAMGTSLANILGPDQCGRF